MDVLEKEQIGFEAAAGHWYYRAKFGLLESWLRGTGLDLEKSRIADFGCGEGLFLALLAREAGVPAENLCGIDSADRGDSRVPLGKITIHREFPPGASFDAILLMDVLEHIDDDAVALADAVRYCKPGGRFFLTFPAMPCLWSRHDEFLGHKRRYTLPAVRDLLAKCHDLETESVFYFYASILPVAAPVRWFRRVFGSALSSDMKPVAPLFNFLAGVLLSTESLVCRWNRLAGLTLVATCRKNP
ncbi:MAG: class I SAM-dependent methyltransferase [Verrucomicrobiota bacterium]